MVTAIIGKDQYKTELITSGHYLLADEPIELNGTNLGASPNEFLMISLASCTAITLRMYADRKKWPVDQIKVDVTFESVEGKTVFELTVSFVGEVDDKQRERLLEIAHSCPVHKILTNPIEVKASLAIDKE